ncbi:hypothetical protein [Cellvibrio japonicus]|nr:hypothetical protein [Cellvibrio japonicus]QEI11289.1 hypothetical protein FY117_02945 [Cellvibrio japonicus]QEI14863.1 hypothetical protein FY116_02945 [Cellvibrio japonicus]QEI18443.1 hypothetical protein FY115_02945 [Cellvibrio japonicus]
MCISGKKAYVVSALALWVMTSCAWGDDKFSIGLGVREYWDSNFARTTDKDAEHYTLSSANLKASHRYGRQQWALGLRGLRYDHAERTDLDTDFYDGKASWRSTWSHRFNTRVAWDRMAYAVDRLEFVGQDVVARDDVNVQVNYGTGDRLSVGVGARQSEQRHSNDLRDSLDFDEEEIAVEVRYQTAGKSRLSLRLRDGNRVYPTPSSTDPRQLDFDYRQAELDLTWVSTEKTRLHLVVGRFERDGDTNSGTGTQAEVEAQWSVTEKFALTLSVNRSEPAVGETSDSPIRVDTGEIGLRWQPAYAWSVQTSARYSEQAYQARALEPARDEEVKAFTPLAVVYRVSDAVHLRLDSQWVERRSPLSYRNIDYALASIGLAMQF